VSLSPCHAALPQLLLYTPKEVLPTSDHLDLADPVLVEKAGTSGSGMRAALLGRHVAWGPLMARAAMGCWGLRMEVREEAGGGGGGAGNWGPPKKRNAD
jgi:hypothetical protein